MSKIGRNDPCPCGSGKKYKKCCAKTSSSSNGRTTSAAKAAYVDAKAVADNLLGKMGATQETSKEHCLILDQYSYESAEVLRKLKGLGKVSEQTVLFYQGKQWIGEADFSVPGQIILTTADLKTANKLGTKLSAIKGLKHEDRSQETFEALDEEEKARVVEEMLDFKVRFFKTWMDEVNERLGGSTPRQAAQVPKLKLELAKLLFEMEEREKKLPKKERYSFKWIRKELKL